MYGRTRSRKKINFGSSQKGPDLQPLKFNTSWTQKYLRYSTGTVQTKMIQGEQLHIWASPPSGTSYLHAVGLIFFISRLSEYLRAFKHKLHKTRRLIFVLFCLEIRADDFKKYSSHIFVIRFWWFGQLGFGFDFSLDLYSCNKKGIRTGTWSLKLLELGQRPIFLTTRILVLLLIWCHSLFCNIIFPSTYYILS